MYDPNNPNPSTPDGVMTMTGAPTNTSAPGMNDPRPVRPARTPDPRGPGGMGMPGGMPPRPDRPVGGNGFPGLFGQGGTNIGDYRDALFQFLSQRGHMNYNPLPFQPGPLMGSLFNPPQRNPGVQSPDPATSYMAG